MGEDIYLTDDIERRYPDKVMKITKDGVLIVLPENYQLKISWDAFNLIQPVEEVGYGAQAHSQLILKIPCLKWQSF